MLQYIARRLIQTIPTVLLVTTFVFLIIHLVPGDPVEMILGDYATPDSIVAMRGALGLDRPLGTQYVSFLTGLIHGDLGTSIRTQRPVMAEIRQRFPYSMMLAFGAVAVSTVLGVPVGVLSATRPGSWQDTISMVGALIGVSMPTFWLGLMLLFLFAMKLSWFPVIGAGDIGNIPDTLQHLVLPVLAIGLSGMALTARMTRSTMLEVLGQDYIRTARSKGLAKTIVIYKHALRNAAIPVVTVVGMNIGHLLGGAVLAETVFARPGLGKMVVDAILARDYPMVQGAVFIIAMVFILVNLLVDVTYAALDPRIHYN